MLLNKEDGYIYTRKYYSAIKRTRQCICSNMNGPRDWHAGWSKSDREGEIVYDIPCMQNIKRNHTNELIYKINRLTDLEN